MVDYDLIIVGAGPAGMNACLYASRAKLKVLVIEKNYPGGKVVKAKNIENYLGQEKIEGVDLALKMFQHSFSFGGEYKQGNVVDIIDYGNYKEVVLENAKYTCYAVIIAIGTSEKKMNIDGEDRLYGKGISYCPICDCSLCKNKIVAVVGNNQYANEGIQILSKYAQKIYCVDCDDSFITDKEKMIDKHNYKMININGKNHVEEIIIKKDENIESIQVDAIFPLLGDNPDTIFVKKLKITNDNKYIVVDKNQQTKIKGIFACGDCTNNVLKQITTASSEGAIAAIESNKYITNLKKTLQ